MSFFEDGSRYSIIVIRVFSVLLALLESLASFDLLNGFCFFRPLGRLLSTFCFTD
jgi:hypothetical protein